MYSQMSTFLPKTSLAFEILFYSSDVGFISRLKKRIVFLYPFETVVLVQATSPYQRKLDYLEIECFI